MNKKKTYRFLNKGHDYKIENFRTVNMPSFVDTTPDFKLGSDEHPILYFINKTDSQWDCIVDHYFNSNAFLVRKDSIEDMQEVIEGRLELRKQGLL